ncbi:MAG TPA: TIGR03621 family F420-dependent LLM class oxidoreductase [Streptosporangiaceae bacterium]|jgi:probable F420-dependent oxidoreductase|nr:TIGR03621 family F420-dependent LLM class oxidoreductase [Streptosporangiaceae bacterium]
MRDFRFSCNVHGLASRAEFVRYCQDAERFGYSTIFTADHLGSPSPFPPLVLAAEVTERLRVGTMVLNVPFWNPHLLAREVATADVLTDGRLELGLGAGHMKWEFDAAGIPWVPLRQRVGAVAATVDELERIFHRGGYPERRELEEMTGRTPLTPVQRAGFNRSGPPLIIGGTGDRILALAAQRADTVALGGLIQAPGQPPGTFTLQSAAQADERVAYIRARAGDRADDLELHVLVQMVVVTPDRRAAAEKIAAEDDLNLTTDEVLETPFLLIGTVPEIAAQLEERRDRFGVTYLTVHDPYMAALAPVIERLGAA